MFSVLILKTMLMKFAVWPEYRPLEEPKGGGANRRQQLEHKLRENWTCAARLGGNAWKASSTVASEQWNSISKIFLQGQTWRSPKLGPRRAVAAGAIRSGNGEVGTTWNNGLLLLLLVVCCCCCCCCCCFSLLLLLLLVFFVVVSFVIVVFCCCFCCFLLLLLLSLFCYFCCCRRF